MKNFFFFLLLGVSVSAGAQNAFRLPSVTVKDINGNSVQTDKFNNDGKPMIINFWAT